MIVTTWLIWSVLLFAVTPRQEARAVVSTFTRPTIAATPLEQPVTFWHELTFEDSEYMFVSRHYGTGGKHVPGFFVYSKSRGAWIQISRISTEHARLGRSPEGPPHLAVGWDYGALIRHEYVSMPLSGGSFITAPDRVVSMPPHGLYRLDYHADLKIDYSLTWFWVRVADLEAAFDGGRGTAPPTTGAPPEGAGLAVPVEAGPLLVAGLRPPGDGTTLACLVDSTSPVTYVDANYFNAPRSGGRVALELVPGVIVKDQRVTVANHLNKGHRAFGGVLGVPFFRAFTVSIDYDREYLHLVDSKTSDYRGSGHSLPLENQYWNPVVRVAMTINGRPIEARLAVDTSSRHTIALNRRFVDERRLTAFRDRTVLIDQPRADAKHFVTRAGSVALGGAVVKDVPVSLVQDPAIAAPLELDGVIGNGLLRRFLVTIDLSNHRLILEPGALADVPYDYDLTGFTIVANGKLFGIGSVEPGTIADQAGLRPGDVIEELDGRRVQGMRLADLQRAFVQDGRERQLKIRRLGVEQIATLKMLAIR